MRPPILQPIAVKFVAVAARKPPPWRTFLAYAGLLLAALWLVAHLHGCAPSPEARSIAADEAYKLEHLRCVAKHETNAEIDDCRAKVRERWHVDGGAR